MPYYSRYRRRTGYSKYRRRYGYRRLGYRRYRRRTTSGSVTSRSRVRVKVQCEEVVQLTISANTVNSTVCSSVPFAHYGTGRPAYTLAAGATESPLYRAYCGLFDQVKCDGVISKVSVTTPVGSGNSSVPALQIVTAYDRAGTYYEASQLRQGTNAQGQVVFINNPMTYPALLASSGSVVRSALNNSVAKLARSCWASDVQERTMFHDCTLQNRGDVPADTNDMAYSQTPNACPFFCPLFYVGFHLPTTAPTQDLTISFILSQTYYFTFRNPKFGSSGGSTSVAAVDDDPIETQTLDDEGLDGPPQAAIDGLARAAAATGRMVRAAPTREETRAAKRARLMDEADRLDRETVDRWRRYNDFDAQVSSRLGTTDITRYPGSDRRTLERLYNAASNNAAAAEKVRDEVHDLDTEDALSRTDTLPLND